MIERAASVALSFGFYSGIMNSNMQNLKDIRTIELSLSTSESADYTDGCMIVNFQARKGSMIKEGRFTCFIYSDDYSPMCNSDITYKFNRENNINVSIVMLSFRIWLPGKYILLIRDRTNGSLARIDFEVDKSLDIKQQPLTMCPVCSIEDILTSCVENTESSWDVLSTTPGTSELRKYALECRQLKIYNDFRTGLSGRELKSNRNLLLYTTNKDWNAEIQLSHMIVVHMLQHNKMNQGQIGHQRRLLQRDSSNLLRDLLFFSPLSCQIGH